MTEDMLTEEYLSRFPTIVRNAIENDKRYKSRFIRRAQTDYEPLHVFRALHRVDEICEDDFLCNVEEAKVYGKSLQNIYLESYAISVNEDPKAVIKSLSMPNVNHPALALAEGTMEKEYGPADFSEYTTHHNWYLYEGAIPIVKTKFEITDKCKKLMREAAERQLADAARQKEEQK